MKQCTSCGSQNDDSSGFCKSCGEALAAAATPPDQQQPYSSKQYPPQPPSPPGQSSPYQYQPQPYQQEQDTQFENHRFKTLGGWLLAVVILNILGVIYDAIVSITGLMETVEYIDQLPFFRMHPDVPESFETALYITIVGQVVGLLTILFTLLFVVQVFQRKSTFLRFHQLGVIVSIFYVICVGIIPNIMLDVIDADFSQNIGIFVGSIVGFFIFALYMSKSNRVRIYMGSDEYMDKAIFAYKNQPPVDYNLHR